MDILWMWAVPNILFTIFGQVLNLIKVPKPAVFMRIKQNSYVQFVVVVLKNSEIYADKYTDKTWW